VLKQVAASGSRSSLLVSGRWMVKRGCSAPKPRIGGRSLQVTNLSSAFFSSEEKAATTDQKAY
jgi:hypothetical protein